IQHCEIMSITDGGIINEGEICRKLNVKGIPNSSEYKIIERDISLIREVNDAHYHVQHISTKEGVELVRNAKRENLKVTSEVCPHHFILSEESLLKYGTNAKMNPPLRTENDIKEIYEGLKDGAIDVICTDHAPHSEDEKKLPLEKAPFGIIGLETAVGLTNTYLIDRRVLTVEDMIYKMSINPRKILNLPEIKIQEGEKANLTVLDLNKKWKVDVNRFHSKSKNCPYDGWELKGKPVGIINNAQHLFYE
ncbi:MAG: dihydroorotase, partial [Ignavibacteria bacterium]